MDTRYVLVLATLAVFAVVGLGYYALLSQQISVDPEFKADFDRCVLLSDNLGSTLNAIIDQDPTKCSGLEMESLCRGMVTHDARLCGENELCQGVANRDVRLCKNNSFCEATVLGDASYCDEFKVQSIDRIHMCKAFVARKSDYFGRPAQVDCADVAIFESATSLRQCSKIVDGDLRTTCLSRFR